MPSLKDAALKVAVLSVLADKVKAALYEARAEQAAAMTEVGADGVNVLLPNGDRVARVALIEGRSTARVAHEQDFFQWVAANHRDQIEEILRVAPGYVNQILADACATGAPFDVDTGELIPGIGVTKGEPYIATSQKKPALIEAAWRNGIINPLDYIEVPRIEPP